ncbi:Oleosin [Heracleum sosnowskyi]|uniref:Oleosin n=1 Tax=Heracleum sosnowskyi TaxID=360622 RepID=A0AAD8HAX1_9APIA|nr:Oleosin [Heracleum sosnowskyi]
MADQQQQPYFQHQHEPHRTTTGLTKNISGSQIMTIMTLFPLGGLLLLIAGITLTGTIIGLAVATPLFVIFSPVLVPAVLTLGLAVTGFITSGAFGITALSSLAWLAKYLRKGRSGDAVETAKRRVQNTAGYVGHRARDLGQKTQEAGRT